MRERVRSGLGAVLFVVGPLLAVVALHRLGTVSWLAIDWSNPVDWLQRATLEEALAGLLRVVGLLAGYWLTGSTLLYLLASATEIPSLVRAATPVTLPIARRLIDGALITSIAVSSLAAPLIARTDDSQVPAPDGVVMVLPPPHLVEETSPEEEEEEALTQAILTVPPALQTPNQSAETGDGPQTPIIGRPDATVMEVIVRTGDNLWVLSERRLAASLGRAPLHSEIEPYWRRVIAANADRIRSGNPDIIHPGEVIILPAITAESR